MCVDWRCPGQSRSSGAGDERESGSASCVLAIFSSTCVFFCEPYSSHFLSYFFAILFPAKLFFHYYKLLMCYHHHRRYYCTRGSLRVFKPNKKHCQHGCLHSCECWLLLILFVCHSVTATVCFCYGGFHYCQVWCYQSTDGERCEEMGWPPSTDAVQQASYAWCNDG